MSALAQLKGFSMFRGCWNWKKLSTRMAARHMFGLAFIYFDLLPFAHLGAVDPLGQA